MGLMGPNAIGWPLVKTSSPDAIASLSALSAEESLAEPIDYKSMDTIDVLVFEQHILTNVCDAY